MVLEATIAGGVLLYPKEAVFSRYSLQLYVEAINEDMYYFLDG